MATVARSFTAPSVLLSQNADSVLEPALMHVWPAGQSVFTTHACVVVTLQLPQVSVTARSSIRPPPLAVLDLAPTHQSVRAASTFGVCARARKPPESANHRATAPAGAIRRAKNRMMDPPRVCIRRWRAILACFWFWVEKK